MSKNLITGMSLMLFCIVLIFAFVLKSGKQEIKITNWAESNGYEIVELEEKESIGPFEFKEKNQKIYRARVKSGDQYKWVWLRIGVWTDFIEE